MLTIGLPGKSQYVYLLFEQLYWDNLNIEEILVFWRNYLYLGIMILWLLIYKYPYILEIIKLWYGICGWNNMMPRIFFLLSNSFSQKNIVENIEGIILANVWWLLSQSVEYIKLTMAFSQTLVFLKIFTIKYFIQKYESNLGLLHCRQIFYHLSLQGSPLVWVIF